jgi:hypothetical protein
VEEADLTSSECDAALRDALVHIENASKVFLPSYLSYHNRLDTLIHR